jgi:uncharacterized membrane protein YozB (DUF420 family)
MTATVAVPRPRARRANRWPWLLVAGLVLLSLIPILGGALRVGDLSAGGAVTPQNARFMASPVPVLVHIVSATLYCLLGSLQFVPSLRRHSWHRRSGRVLFVAGLLVALSGLWMTLTYPWPAGDGVALFVLRLAFGSLMAVSLVLGLRAILRRNVEAHRTWMARAYALGIAAGTQALALTAWQLALGQPDEAERAAVMGGSWLLNLAVVEVARIVRARRRPSRPTAVRPASARPTVSAPV